MPTKPSKATPAEEPFKEITAIGEIQTGASKSSTIKVREVEIAPRNKDEKLRRVLDVRTYVENERFKGFTGKGVSIPADQVEELRDLCNEFLALTEKRTEKKATKKAAKAK